MKSRTAKIIVDILLFAILIFELIPTAIIPVRFHFIVGFVFTALMLIHISLNGKWCVSVTKALFTGKANKKVKRQYALNLSLLIIWSLVALTGLPAMGYAMNRESGEFIEVLFVLRNVHVALAIMGTTLIVFHIFQHRKQIHSYLRKKSDKALSVKQQQA